jgi:hypothetical protein
VANSETETLDLYNESSSLTEMLDRIMDFIQASDDIIIYYCGHGDVGLRDGDYRVFLRRKRRHTLLSIVGLINDVKRQAQKKRVYFVLDACYSGSAVSEMETMDVGGAEALIDRRLYEAVTDGGSGTAVLTASGRLGVALAKQEDELTLFTGAFVRCLKEGVVHKTHFPSFSWLDLKDEIIRVTRDRLGPDAPIPRLTCFSESISDITRVPFFSNSAFRGGDGSDPHTLLDERISEQLYWKSISEESPAYVFEDFLIKFQNGMFAVLARARLADRIKEFDESELESYLLDHPRTVARDQIYQRLAGLKWVNLQGSTDVGALERFAQRFSQSKLKEDALRRIESVRAEPLRETTAQPEASDPMQQTLLDQGSTLGSTGDKSPPDLRTPDGKKRARRLAVLVVVAVGVVIALLQRGTPNRRDSQGNVTAENSAPRGDGNAPSTSSPPQIDAKLVTRPEPPRPASFNKYLNYDMKGGDISSSDGNIFRRTDASGCQARCRANAACLAYSFDKWNSACYLKSTLSVLTLASLRHEHSGRPAASWRHLRRTAFLFLQQ